MRRHFRFLTALLLVAICISSFLLNLHHLDHSSLTYWDESFHALVAKNLLKHPSKPTLIEKPYLPYDYQDWSANHVWLHKGIFPLWIIALSFSLIGITPLALRLPSLLFSTLSVVLTYLIGVEVMDATAGLVAAAIQAFLPELTLLVQGYLFSDHVDVCLLFWTEAAVYFLFRAMRIGKFRNALISGACGGLAYLSKSYVSLIVPVLAVGAWLLPNLRLGKHEETSIHGRQVIALIASFMAIAAPWTLYCMGHYPKEFFFETGYAFEHLFTDVEGLAAPWDRVLFDYAIYLFHAFYTPVLVAAFVLLPKTLKEKNTKLWMLYIWVVGVLLPNSIAITKTPTSILVGMPAFLLLLGCLVSDSIRGNRAALIAWIGVMITCLVFPAVIVDWERGYPHPAAFAGVMRQHLWVLWHLLATFAVLGIVLTVAKHFPKNLHYAGRVAVAFCVMAMIFLEARIIHDAWMDTYDYQGQPNFREIARFAQTRLPQNAVLLFEWNPLKWRIGAHQLVMFWSDRTCYSLEHARYDMIAPQVAQNGGIPYLVSPRDLPLPIVFHSLRDHRQIYALMPEDGSYRVRPAMHVPSTH